MNASEYAYTFKFIIVGDSGVGKSCILMRFCQGSFTARHDVTIGVEFASRIVQVEEGINCKLQVWDTAGQEAFKSITRSYYRGAICCCLVYDITRRNSFDSIAQWLEDVQEYSYNRMQIILIGNKSDLENQREVSTEEGVRFANKNDLIFFETSALTASHIEDTFLRAAADVFQGILTQRYDKDEQGNYIGITPGNSEIPTAKRMSMRLGNSGYLNESMPDLRASYKSKQKVKLSGGAAQKKKEGCC